MADDNNKPADERGKSKPRGKGFIIGGQSPSATTQGAMFRPEEPSPPLTPEREAARQLLSVEERKMVAAMERELVRPLTEEEERLVLEPGPLIEQPPANNSHDPHFDQPNRLRCARPDAPLGSVGYDNEINENGERLIWLDRAVIDRLPFLRGSGESYNDVILRLAESG
jgi:hypothetical protein